MPREKRVPEPKPLTRWEKFAKEKNIKNKKRERMVFDEATGEYRPRFGYKRVDAGVAELPIVEVKHGADPYADPWAAAKAEKKEKVNKNARNRERNELIAQGKPLRRRALPGSPYGKCILSLCLFVFFFLSLLMIFL